MRISLLHPEARELIECDSRVTAERLDILTPWPFLRVNIAKVANVLNRTYYSESAISNCIESLWAKILVGGRLVIVENRSVEKVGVYVRTQSGFSLDVEMNGGSEIDAIVREYQSG